MGLEILLRFIIVLELGSVVLALVVLAEDPTESWPVLVAAAIFVSFLYYVFHIPVRKKLNNQES